MSRYRHSHIEIIWFVEQMLPRATTSAHRADLNAIIKMLWTGLEPGMLTKGTG